MKATTLIVHIMLTALACSPMKAMNRLGHRSWPPLLWAAQQPIKPFAQTLQTNAVTLEQYIQSQLTHARADLFAYLARTTPLTKHDLAIIPATIETIRATDAQKSVRQTMRRDQQLIRNQLPEIELIAKECNYPTPFEVLPDESTTYDAYALREVNFNELDDSLILSHPEKGTYPLPQLYVGKPLWGCSKLERIGALLRIIGGHMLLEHYSELTLYDQVLAIRGMPADMIVAILTKIAKFQELEADLLPAAQNKEYAQAIKAHVQRDCIRFADVPNGQERIRNLEWVDEMHQAMEPLYRNDMAKMSRTKG